MSVLGCSRNGWLTVRYREWSNLCTSNTALIFFLTFNPEFFEQLKHILCVWTLNQYFDRLKYWQCLDTRITFTCSSHLITQRGKEQFLCHEFTIYTMKCCGIFLLEIHPILKKKDSHIHPQVRSTKLYLFHFFLYCVW